MLCVHLDFERAICCGLIGFTKGAILSLYYDYIIALLNLIIKINKIKINK